MILGTRAEGGLGSPCACWFLEALGTTINTAQRICMNKRILGQLERGGEVGFGKGRCQFLKVFWWTQFMSGGWEALRSWVILDAHVCASLWTVHFKFYYQLLLFEAAGSPCFLFLLSCRQASDDLRLVGVALLFWEYKAGTVTIDSWN